MLKKSERLTRRQFTEFFKTGRRYHSPTLTIIHTSHPNFHASVVVGKKVAKLAVRRNTVRRRIYEQLRRFAKEQSITGVFIVITKPAFNSLTRAQANRDVAQLLQKICGN